MNGIGTGSPIFVNPFNTTTYNITNFEDYMHLYLNNFDEKKFTFKPNDRWTIGICNSQTFNFQQVSFVNGINTNRGGKHVEYVVKQITSEMIKYISKKKKQKKIIYAQKLSTNNPFILFLSQKQKSCRKVPQH